MKKMMLFWVMFALPALYGQDIFQAVKSEDLKTLRLLVESGQKLNVSKDGCPLIYYAILSGNVDMVRYMEQKGARANSSMYLVWAVRSKKLPMLKYFIEEKKISVNTLTGGDVSALLSAASYRQWDMVRYLIDKKADVNLASEDDQTPLMFAANGGNLEIIKYLIQKGADVSLKDNSGQTARDYALDPDIRNYLDSLVKIKP